MAYKVYKNGQYILIEDLDNNSLTDYPAKDVRFDKPTDDATTFTAFYNGSPLAFFTAVKIGNIQKESGVVYTIAEFNTWYQKNTANNSSVEQTAGLNNTWLCQAINNIFSDYGDVVSVEDKKKDLLKFGRNALVNTSKSTLMTLPTGTDNETYVSSNLITQISSASAGDTGDVIIEGHTSADGITFVFIIQTATLDGQNIVTLDTPIARVSRVENDGATDLVGRVYVCETDTVASGVPDTDAKVHLIVEAGKNNSHKAATTISNVDYYIITSFYVDCLEKTAAFGIMSLEIRKPGKTFLEKIELEASTNGEGRHKFEPYLICAKNSDIRIVGEGSAANKDFSGGFEGVLASVIT